MVAAEKQHSGGLFSDVTGRSLYTDSRLLAMAQRKGWITDEKRNELQERVFNLTVVADDPEIVLKAAALAEKMYQADRKAEADEDNAGQPKKHLHLHAIGPAGNLEQRKQAIRDRITQQAGRGD